jgi:undecaprenyl-diphosphatase
MAGIIDFLLQLDFTIFEKINGLQLPLYLENFFTFWRNSYVWAPLYIFIISFAAFNFNEKAKWFIMFCLLTVGTTDIISSKVIKLNVQRLRPCNTEHLEVINRVRCGSGYSFTSSHAANHFGLATFWVLCLGFMRKRYKFLLLFWASLIGFCQVYVGVHFPLDVLFGSVVGVLIGYIFAKLFVKYYHFQL